MKKYIFAILALVAFSASADDAPKGQAEQADNAAKVISMPKTEWLPSYSKVVIEGAVNVVFKHADNFRFALCIDSIFCISVYHCGKDKKRRKTA